MNTSDDLLKAVNNADEAMMIVVRLLMEKKDMRWKEWSMQQSALITQLQAELSKEVAQ